MIEHRIGFTLVIIASNHFRPVANEPLLLHCFPHNLLRMCVSTDEMHKKCPTVTSGADDLMVYLATSPKTKQKRSNSETEEGQVDQCLDVLACKGHSRRDCSLPLASRCFGCRNYRSFHSARPLMRRGAAVSRCTDGVKH